MLKFKPLVPKCYTNYKVKSEKSTLWIAVRLNPEDRRASGEASPSLLPKSNWLCLAEGSKNTKPPIARFVISHYFKKIIIGSVSENKF